MRWVNVKVPPSFLRMLHRYFPNIQSLRKKKTSEKHPTYLTKPKPETGFAKLSINVVIGLYHDHNCLKKNHHQSKNTIMCWFHQIQYKICIDNLMVSATTLIYFLQHTSTNAGTHNFRGLGFLPKKQARNNSGPSWCVQILMHKCNQWFYQINAHQKEKYINIIIKSLNQEWTLEWSHNLEHNALNKGWCGHI